MARMFDTTIPNDTATANPGGTVRLVFTVTNTSQRPVRARLELKAWDGAQPGWLSVVGEREREFPPALANQVEVEVKVPAGTAGGKYKVRLDTRSVLNPDEDFTEGPPVAINVEPKAVVVDPGGTKPNWWIYVVAAVVVLVVGGVVAWLLTREPDKPVVAVPTVPADIKGKPIDIAEKQLQDLGYSVKRTSVPITDDCPGKVVTTVPAPGASAPKTDPVVVSVGMLPYGPATCRAGFVWREALSGDTVCVTPQSRAQAQQDNQLMAERSELVVATAKDFDEIQKETPSGGTVAKGDFSRLAALVPNRIHIDPAQLVPRVRRCKAPYTERRATAQDRVCVTQQVQIRTDAENHEATKNMACPKP